MEITDITPENCSLSWKPPADDGGSPVTNYVVEKLDPALNASDSINSFYSVVVCGGAVK